MKFAFITFLLFFIACSEGNPNNPFEGNTYNVSIGKTEQFIGVDSIKELPSSINSSSYEENIYEPLSDRDSTGFTYEDQFDTTQIDSINYMYDGLKRQDLYYYYSSIPKYANNLYKSLYFIKRVLSVVDDGLLPLNMNEVRNGGLNIKTVTSADSTTKSLSVTDTTGNSVVDLLIKEQNYEEHYTSEFNSIDTFFTSTKINVAGSPNINTIKHVSVSSFGTSTLNYQQNLLDSNITASFTLKTPNGFTESFINSNDTIFIKGFVFDNGSSLIQAFIGTQDNDFQNTVRDTGVVNVQNMLYRDSIARSMFFWSLDNDATIDTGFTYEAYDSSRVETVTFDDVDKFYALNYYSITTAGDEGTSPYFASQLHLFFIRDNLYYMREDGMFNFYGDDAPNAIKKYINYAPFLDAINF